jgi:hypothetical protein
MTGKCMVSEDKAMENQKVNVVSLINFSVQDASKRAVISAPLPQFIPFLPSNFVKRDSKPCR